MKNKINILLVKADPVLAASRSMDVYITRIRKHLINDGSLQIINVRGKDTVLLNILKKGITYF